MITQNKMNEYYSYNRLLILMLSLRKIVAGPKIRTVENGYDLDLSYVTNRVIAMAFPAEGF